ncbi:MAG: azurin [Bacteroidetes bacterium]|nr:azurin [Bacteroidota bacterium]MBS1629355.1 azurin [Bacteroidota bacterium]
MNVLRFGMLAFSALSLSLFACNSGGNQSSTATDTTTTTAPTTTPSKEVTLELSGSDQMQYDKQLLHVSPGQDVTLIFHHAGKMPKTAMGHNFVLLQQGTDMHAFDSAARVSGDPNFIPQKLSSEIIAHTKLLGGGESDTIKFAAPPAGSYDYLCTFPGHSATMFGKFVVQ